MEYSREEQEVSESLPNFHKCCFFLNLRVGLNIWLFVESIIWLGLFILSTHFEVVFLNTDFVSLLDETEGWYFKFIFGDKFYYMDEKIRSS